MPGTTDVRNWGAVSKGQTLLLTRELRIQSFTPVTMTSSIRLRHFTGECQNLLQSLILDK
jgi:hypothetical protein